MKAGAPQQAPVPGSFTILETVAPVEHVIADDALTGLQPVSDNGGVRRGKQVMHEFNGLACLPRRCSQRTFSRLRVPSSSTTEIDPDGHQKLGTAVDLHNGAPRVYCDQHDGVQQQYRRRGKPSGGITTKLSGGGGAPRVCTADAGAEDLRV